MHELKSSVVVWLSAQVVQRHSFLLVAGACLT